MQIKVKDTRMHKVKDAFCQIAEGKLVLIPIFYNGKINPGVIEIDKKYFQPIIISETEKIEVGDWILTQENELKQVHRIDKSEDKFQIPHWIYTIDSQFYHLGRNLKSCKKVLALPEHFSPKHLQAIVDGKMKDGDKVLVECEMKYGCPESIKHYFIKLNSSNHITLHKLEEPMYKENKILKVLKQIAEEHIPISFRKEAVTNWLKEME